ncbi:MAG TPA: tRNA (adenosine(37)-N6)-threonylcarbamoyltransferase complex ATPase subunit type 1 TsaE [Burkholderiaceae bacterium]|nr:tRNA (adenosine(37)-N6)-threonylcarbamoyltransferase complex ATPase subunit type 1 TsaE [Burkholderiaceae bacterium]
MRAPPPVLAHRRLLLNDEAATAALAQRLAAALSAPALVFLSGDLGTGKTTLVRALLRSLGFEDRVKSPTFTLVEPYNLSSFDLYHFDLYRFSSDEEWRDAGFDDYLRSGAVCVVEWPERAAGALPVPDLWLRLQFAAGSDDARAVDVDACTDAGCRWLTSVADAGSDMPP